MSMNRVIVFRESGKQRLIPRIHYEQRKSSDYQNETGPMTELFVDADDPEVEVRRLM
jgi:hypothetical protein